MAEGTNPVIDGAARDRRRIRPRWVALAAFGAMTVIVTTSAAATPVGEREVVVDQVTWTVKSETCSQLPDGVTIEGTGTRHTDVITRTRRDGTKAITADQVAIGTAKGSDGHDYQWKYLNTAKTSNSAADPDSYVGVMTDSFELTGGPAAYVNGFEADVVDNPTAGTFTADPIDVVGDPFDFENSSGRCDPI
jgi:hypothetical protein